MSFAFCVLGSGSGGNSTLVICHAGPDDRREEGPDRAGHCFLIDAGLSPRATAKRMASLGITLQDICAIILTHLDSDHFQRGWLRIINRLGIKVHVHERHRKAAWRADLNAANMQLFNGHFTIEPYACALESVLLAHDDVGSVGFVLEHDGLRIGYATDLGCVPDALFDTFQGLHALAIESNYDRQMQVQSGRPWFLKRRIMGGQGHLSNEQALEAVRQIAATSTLSQLALLHLSQQCNCPNLVRSMWQAQEPELAGYLTITEQRRPTALLKVQRPASRGVLAPVCLGGPGRGGPARGGAGSPDSLDHQPTLFAAL